MRRRQNLLEATREALHTAQRHSAMVERGYRTNRFIRKIRPNLVPGHPRDNPRQRLFLGCAYRELMFGGAAGGSKALAVTTPLPSPDGWTTMGAVRVGDRVFGPDGSPAIVTDVSPVYRQTCFEVRFSDGSKLIAGGDHKWQVFTAEDRNKLHRRTDAFREKRRAVRPSRSKGKKPWLAERNKKKSPKSLPAPTGMTVDTQELRKMVRGSRRKLSIPMTKPLQYGTANLPIDPYVFGVWLGDGNNRTGRVTAYESGVVEGMRQRGRTMHSYDYNANEWRVDGLTSELRELDVIQNKHIPSEYLQADRSQRLELLKGLMDTDGNSTQNGASVFNSTCRQLAVDACELIRSLGWRVRMTQGRAKLNGKDCGPSYRCKFTPTEPVFTLTRKAVRQRAATCRIGWKYVVSVTPTKIVETKCIRVDHPSHCFLAGEAMTVTHNSDALGLAALQFVDVPGYSALILMSQFKDLDGPSALRSRMSDWLSPFAGEGVRWRAKENRFIFPTRWQRHQVDWKKRELGKLWNVEWWTIADSDALHHLGAPKPASVTFGYVGTAGDEMQYKSQEFQTVCWDELTRQPLESRYLFLFSRMRGADWLSDIPHRMLSATNPGDVGQEWVRDRFITKEYIAADQDERFALRVWEKDNGACKDCRGAGRKEDDAGEYECHTCGGSGRGLTRFIPSRAKDNKAINRREYESALSNLTAVERARMESGDWTASTSGKLFKRDWIRYFTWAGGWRTGHFVVSHTKIRRGENGEPDYYEPHKPRSVDRHEGYFFLTADTAQSEKTTADFTVICAWAYIAKTGDLLLVDIFRERITTPRILPELDRMSRKWGAQVARVENKSSGVAAIQTLEENPTLAPTVVIIPYEPGTRDKVLRSQTAQAMMGNGHIYFPKVGDEPDYDVEPLGACIEELMLFNDGLHDDFVDNVSMAAEHVKSYMGPEAAPSAVGGYYEDSLSSVGGYGGMSGTPWG